jgi:hypothetical protein
MSSMQKIFRKLIGPVHEIGWRAFMPRRDGSALMAAYWHEYAKTWIFRGLLGSIAGFTLTKMLANTYFAEAAKQAANSPLLWNMIVVIGLLFALFGVLSHVIQLDRCAGYLFDSARATLKFASEAGALTYGVLIGMFIFAVADSKMDDLLDYLIPGIGLLFMVIILGLNLIVWWVAYCLKPEIERPEYFSYIGRHPFILAMICVALISLLVYVSAVTTPNHAFHSGGDSAANPYLQVKTCSANPREVK